MSLSNVELNIADHPSRDDLEITLPRYTAEYLAEVLEAEYARTRDGGALEIAAEIRRAYRVFDDEASSRSGRES